MQELKNFRKNYPQYSDLKDNQVVRKLSSTYPDAYGDLTEKFTKSLNTRDEFKFNDDAEIRLKKPMEKSPFVSMADVLTGGEQGRRPVPREGEIRAPKFYETSPLQFFAQKMEQQDGSEPLRKDAELRKGQSLSFDNQPTVDMPGPSITERVSPVIDMVKDKAQMVGDIYSSGKQGLADNLINAAGGTLPGMILRKLAGQEVPGMEEGYGLGMRGVGLLAYPSFEVPLMLKDAEIARQMGGSIPKALSGMKRHAVKKLYPQYVMDAKLNLPSPAVIGPMGIPQNIGNALDVLELAGEFAMAHKLRAAGTKAKEILSSPKMQGKLSGIRYRVKKLFGIKEPSELMTLSPKQQASILEARLKEGKITQSDIAKNQKAMDALIERSRGDVNVASKATNPVVDLPSKKPQIIPEAEKFAKIAEQSGIKFRGLQEGYTKKSGEVVEGKVFFDAPSGSTLSLKASEFTPEAAKVKIDAHMKEWDAGNARLRAATEPTDSQIATQTQKQGIETQQPIEGLKTADIEKKRIEPQIQEIYDEELAKQEVETEADTSFDFGANTTKVRTPQGGPDGKETTQATQAEVLAEEAKKYKTAEEFIENNHHTSMEDGNLLDSWKGDFVTENDPSSKGNPFKEWELFTEKKLTDIWNKAQEVAKKPLTNAVKENKAVSSMDPEIKTIMENMKGEGKVTEKEYSEMMAPDIWSGLKTGQKTTLTAYRGTGRSDVSSVYADGVSGAALGDGEYHALNKEYAKKFGNEISESQITLENPYVINSTQDLEKLAGQNIPYGNEDRIPILGKIRKEIQKLGHDGIIVNVPLQADVDSAGNSVKRLREIFEESQVVVFRKGLPAHLQKFADKAKGITDVTPKGYGSTPSGTASSRPSKGTEWHVAEDGTQVAPLPKDMPHFDAIRSVEMPELVQLAKDLGAGTPTLKKFKVAGGMFYPGKGQIKLSPSIFKDPKDAAAVLAHEIGHLIDWLPDGSMKKGNEIGRMISSVRKFMKITFNPSTGEGASAKDLAVIRKKAFTEFLDIKGIKRKEWKDNKETFKKEWQEYLQQYKNEVLKRDGYIQNKKLRDEMKALTMKWSPYDRANAPAAYIAYRDSAVELYAEFMSVLLNAPKMALDIAPTAYKMFFEYLDRKPGVKDAYFGLQAMLAGDQSAIHNMRKKNMYQMFETAEQEVKSIKMRGLAAVKSLPDRLAQAFIDKNHYILKGRGKVAKKQRINPEDDPKYLLEESNYIGSVVRAYLEDLKPAYTKMINSEVENEVGAILFLDRVRSGDRSELANPMGFSPQTAEDFITKLQKDSPDKYEKAQEVVISLREWFQDLNKRLGEDILSESQKKLIAGNDKYAPYRVIKHLTEYISAGIAPQQGTLSEIGNPFNAMVLKGISMIRAIERNSVMKKVGHFIEKNSEVFGRVEPAKITSYPGVFKVRPHKDAYMKPIVWRSEGKWEGLYVEKEIADTFKYDSTGTIADIGNTLGFALGNNVFRNLYITFNVGFQSFNLVRDFLRYWKNVPGMTIPKAMKSYFKAFPSSVNRVKGTPDKLISKMEKEKALTITFNDLLKGENTEDKEIMAVMKEFGLMGKDKPRSIFDPIGRVLDAIKFSGDVIETIPKVAGYTELKYMSEKERAYHVRNLVGTPNFKRGGTMKPIYNNVFLFSNIIKEAYRGLFEVAGTNEKTRGSWWWKTAKVNMMPKILMALASAGAFGGTLKYIMDSASEYDKTNYTIIPLGVTEQGDAIYMRMPQDEEGRTFSGIFWKTINAKDFDFESGMQDILSFTGEQVPFSGTAPGISIGGVWSDYTKGKMPRDDYRGSDILTQKELDAGGTDALIPMLKWTANQSGHVRFDIHDRYKDDPMYKKVLPFVPILNRYIKITKYGRAQTLYKDLDKARKVDARESIDKDKMAKKVMAGEATILDAMPMMKNKSDLVLFLKKINKTKYLAKSDDPVAIVIKSATSKAQKKEVFRSAVERGFIEKAELPQYIVKLAKNSIISGTFANELATEFISAPSKRE